VLENFHLSSTQCIRVQTDGKLDVGYGEVLVAKQGITEFQVSPVGRIYTDGGVAYCEGERHKKPGREEVLDLLLVLSAYKLEVLSVELRVNQETEVHDMTHQSSLPVESCPYRAGTCDAGGLTRSHAHLAASSRSSGRSTWHGEDPCGSPTRKKLL
jgi:hypothetical protein